MNINLTLIGQMIAFVCFVMFCMKYVWPPIIAAMAEREKKISDGLAAADRASHDLELAQEKAVERLKEAKTEAAGIVDAANKRGSQLVEEAKQCCAGRSRQRQGIRTGRDRAGNQPGAGTAAQPGCSAVSGWRGKSSGCRNRPGRLTTSWSRSWQQSSRAGELWLN